MTTTKVAVVKETEPGERRVALVPDVVQRLHSAGLEVLVESGAGEKAWFPDISYSQAGAIVLSADQLYETAEVIVAIQPIPPEQVVKLRSRQTLIAMLQPLANLQLVETLADKGVTAISLDALPRTLSRAQSMDALSSQASITGYKAVLVAASAFGRYFPMLTTAAGTERPAELLVIGTGVAGLQAIGTARRLGAIVKGYDVREETKEEVESLGATFLHLGSVSQLPTEGGYARPLTPSEQAALQAELAEHLGKQDVVITAAQTYGRRPPSLVTVVAIDRMRPGSVIVDAASSPMGGNVELSEPGRTLVTAGGITIIGADNLPSTMAPGASTAYARNMSALLFHLLADGVLRIDLTDEIQAAVVITHDGKVVQEATAERLQEVSGAQGESRSRHPLDTEGTNDELRAI